MNPNPNQQSNENSGYMVVRVSTARGAIPLEGASVGIRGNTPESSGIVYSLTTNSDGLTEKVSLPAPPRANSESPGSAENYSSWNIDVFKEGYVPIFFQNVPVFSSIVSVQPAVMIPIAENFRSSETVRESAGADL